MRVVLQRVSSASVTIDGSVKSEIGQGILILLGIENAAVGKIADWIDGILAAIKH